VSKNDLLARVWPTMEEGSLRFHMVRLRKALGDGKGGPRYIATLTGRGYRFVAPISWSSDRVEEIAAAARFPHSNPPGRLIGMFERERGRRV
jgi:DNA-binding winged helix-turn-helix (wHTH) protein